MDTHYDYLYMGLFCLADAIRSLNITASLYEKKNDREKFRYERFMLDWGILWLGINTYLISYLCLA